MSWAQTAANAVFIFQVDMVMSWAQTAANVEEELNQAVQEELDELGLNDLEDPTASLGKPLIDGEEALNSARDSKKALTVNLAYKITLPEDEHLSRHQSVIV